MSDVAVDITYEVLDRKGTTRLSVTSAAGPFTDTINILKFRDRNRFLDNVHEQHLGLDREALRVQLEGIAAEAAKEPVKESPDGSDASDTLSEDPSKVGRLVALAQGAYTFVHSPGCDEAEPYVVFEKDGRRETQRLDSKGFKRRLARDFYLTYNEVPGAQAVADALVVLSGIAIHEGEERDVFIRVAGHGGRAYLDLADKGGRVVEVTSTGWQVMAGTDVPVHFIRPKGMLPLPVPVRGGSIDQLRPLVHFDYESDWVLFIAYLVGALNPEGPYPILRLEGEHGSAKTCRSRMVRSLIDPNKAAVRRPPKGDRDLMIAANNSWMIALENLSSISDNTSDTLCAVSTGGAYSVRELYTNGEETLFEAKRPILVNGISNVGSRPDFIDRAISLLLRRIPRERMMTEGELWEKFSAIHASVLGALLDAVSCALRRKGEVHVEDLPRMADFACWVVAAEPALGFPPGAFMRAFRENREAGDRISVEVSPIGPTLVAFLEQRRSWEGTAARLVAELEDFAEDRTTRSKEWPGTATRMAHALRRIAPNLRALGYIVELDQRSRDRNRERLVVLEEPGEKVSKPSEPSGEEPAADSLDGLDTFSPTTSREPDPEEECLWSE